MRLLRYKPHRKASAQTHPYVRSFEDGVLHGQQVLRLLLDLKAKGYRPDVVVAHPGWGESLYVREAFPSARLIHFCEYYYRAQGLTRASIRSSPSTPTGRRASAAAMRCTC